MSSSVDEDEQRYPKTLAELADFMDGVEASEDVRVRFRLGSAQRHAAEMGSVDLLAGINAEGNAYFYFHDVGSLGASIVDVRVSFDESMMRYIKHRLSTTTQPRLRARYAHVIASSTHRADDGRRAVEAYADAVEHYLPMEAGGDVDAFHALHDIVPIMVVLARKYKVRDRILPILIKLVGVRNPYLRKNIIELIVDDRGSSRDLLQKTRHAAIDTIFDLRGTPELNDIQAMADLGMRLDSRLGLDDSDAWLHQQARAYRSILESAEHPYVKEQAAQRAALIFQRLGEEKQRIKMIEAQRKFAGRGLEYETLSFSIDETGELANSVRDALDRALIDGGPVRILAFLGASASFLPTLKNSRALLDEQERQGIGAWSEIATTIVRSSDLRVIAQAAPGIESQKRRLWDAFGYGWLFASYVMAVAAQHSIASGTVTVENFISFLSQSWIGLPEENEPNDLVTLLAAPVRIYVGLLKGDAHEDATVLAIDSLTLRFEAIFRKLARSLALPDWVERRDDAGRIRTEVVGLRFILGNSRLAEFLGEDLLAFVRYTLARDDEGLRDKIAHGATHVTDYSLQTVHALIFLLLRLAMRTQTRAASVNREEDRENLTEPRSSVP